MIRNCKTIIVSLVFIFLNSYCFSQIREILSRPQQLAVKKDFLQFGLANYLSNNNYDSALLIHYKAGVYFIAKHSKDSIRITQFISVDKLKSPSSRKVVKRIVKSEVVYDGNTDTAIFTKNIFDSLYSLGGTKKLNNPKIKETTVTQNSDVDHLILSTFVKGAKKDEFMLNFFWMNDPELLISGWQLKRLILQLYFNSNHWMKVDKIIKSEGKGFYILNNYIDYNTIYSYDGLFTFKEQYSNLIWKNYFPTQFVKPSQPKPENKYPILPLLPKGAKFLLE